MHLVGLLDDVQELRLNHHGSLLSLLLGLELLSDVGHRTFEEGRVQFVHNSKEVLAVNKLLRRLIVVRQVGADLRVGVDLTQHTLDSETLELLDVDVGYVLVQEILLGAVEQASEEVDAAVALWRQEYLIV